VALLVQIQVGVLVAMEMAQQAVVMTSTQQLVMQVVQVYQAVAVAGLRLQILAMVAAV
jgi:hypothetical protein